jgi:hypothetical protein
LNEGMAEKISGDISTPIAKSNNPRLHTRNPHLFLT